MKPLPVRSWDAQPRSSEKDDQFYNGKVIQISIHSLNRGFTNAFPAHTSGRTDIDDAAGIARFRHKYMDNFFRIRSGSFQ